MHLLPTLVGKLVSLASHALNASASSFAVPLEAYARQGKSPRVQRSESRCNAHKSTDNVKLLLDALTGRGVEGANNV